MSDKVTNIDYGTIPEDIKKLQESISKTVSRFTNYRKSLNYKTQEEKTEEMYRKAKEDQANIPEDMNSEDVYMWYNNYQHDPKKQAEFRQQGAQTAGLLMTIPMTIASAGTMGWIPALTSTATGMIGGYGGYKAGEYLDKKYDTNWIASSLGFVGGMAGGITGYKGLVRAGSNGLLKGKGNLYGKSFMGDVMADMAKSTEIATPSYGKVKYYGPTMGKTTAAKTNTNLVDFDDYVRPELEQLASELGITRQQLMMSQDPTIREKARQLMLKSIDGWKKNSGNDGKTLVISKSDILQDPVFDNQPLVLQRDEFLKRNAARGETDLQNSMDWYASTRRKGGDKLMEWPDPEGVYISELEPFTPDPHKITLPTSTEITLLSMQDMIPTKFTSIPHLKPLGGKMIADKVANHPHILDRTKRLQQVYKRFIDPDYVPNNNWRKTRIDTPSMKIVDDITPDQLNMANTNSPTGNIDNVGGYYSHGDDQVVVRRSSPDAQASTAFHEELHGHGFGQDKINDWIITHLIDPEKVNGMSSKSKNYYLNSHEAPVHTLQHGFDKGLDIGAPYPGDTAFDDIMSKYGGAMWYFKMNTSKDKRRLWRAMTGDLFIKEDGGKINPQQ